MRFLHTGDWHLGRTIRGRSRRAEFEAVLAEVVEIAAGERVDLVLVCGDIWDAASPPPEADRLLYDVLRELVGRGIEVLLLGGNHDSPRRLEALGRLSELLGVRTQPYVRPRDQGGLLTVERGGEVARIAAVPWVPEGFVVDALGILAPEHEARQEYHDKVAKIYGHMAEGFEPGTINILAAHVFVDGALLSAVDGSERRLHIDQSYAVSPQSLPASAQYAALGHMHQPQVIADAAAPAAYCGSLLQLDFGERAQQKVVRIVEAHPGRPAEHRAVPLTKGRPLVELRGPVEAVRERAEGAGEAYIRAVLDLDAPEPGLAQRLRDDFPNIVDVRLEYAREELAPAAEFANLAPEELFARYHRAQHGVAPSEEMLALFRELMAEAVAAE
jgi:DNA repair protein SbcD/Mre11